MYLLKNKAYNLRNFSTFAAILKILNPQCIAVVVRTPPGAQVTFRASLHKWEISEFTHFKMAHASCWTFRLSLLLGDRFSKEQNK